MLHLAVPGIEARELFGALRAQIMAGDPPACSQLKGPEINAWSKIAPTVNLDAIAECLALLEETRWSPGMPYGLREELGEPLRQAQAAVAAGKEWVKRGIVR